MKRNIFSILVFSFFLVGQLYADANETVWTGTASDVTLTTDQYLTIASGAIDIDGHVHINAEDDAFVNIGASAGSGSVTCAPKSVGTYNYGHLIFNVDAGKTLTVKVWNDFFCHANTKKLYVTCRGKGTTRFRLPSGKNIYFGPETPGAGQEGVQLAVLMDLEEEEAFGVAGTKDKLPVDQLLFEKWSYDVDTVNTDLSQHSTITIGQKSNICYLSNNRVGTSEDAITPGHGSIGFDPSNKGTGRLIIEIARGESPGDFLDGSINIYGTRVNTTGANSTITDGDIITNVQYKYRAGLAALFRVVDTVAYRALVPADTLEEAGSEAYNTQIAAWNNRGIDDRRGLVILNHNNSLPRFANNYDQKLVRTSSDPGTLDQSMWYLADTYQTGFVLGNNGQIEVDHNLFIDYFACSLNRSITDGVHVTAGDTGTDKSHHASKVKKHNPSALIIDGCAFAETTLTGYEYNDLSYGQLTLRGTAGLLARCAASSQTGAIMQKTNGIYIDGTLGKGSYNGSVLNILQNDGSVSPDQSTDLDGEHAIEVMGRWTILGLDGPSGPSVEPVNGYINIPTVMTDHTGQELEYSSGGLSRAGARPLALNSTEYYRYNMSSVLVNNQIDMYGTTIVHNDLSRDLSGLPHSGKKALPILIGGELASLNVANDIANNYEVFDYTGPVINLFNSHIDLHESLVVAGVRFGIHEQPIDVVGGETWENGHNNSTVTFYNRGKAYDKKLLNRGRVFQLGSRANVMADGSTIDPVLEPNGVTPSSSLRDAFIDIYRQARSEDPNAGANTNIINFTFKTAHENGVPTDERATQVFYLANRSQVNCGWTTLTGDARPEYAPWKFSDDIIAQLLANQELTYVIGEGNSFSSYKHGVGEFKLAGNNFYIGAGGRYDRNGKMLEENELSPGSINDGGGCIFVDHGGKLSLDSTASYDAVIGTLIGRRLAAESDAVGIVDLPSDQVKFAGNGSVWPYGIDFSLTGDIQPAGNQHAGLVMLDASKGEVSIDVPSLDVPVTFSPIKALTLAQSEAGNSIFKESVYTPQSGERELGDMGMRGFTNPLFDQTNNVIDYGLTRTTQSIASPVAMPTSGMLVMTTGHKIDQLKVSGATRANPLHLWVSGDGDGFGRVKEFVTVPSAVPVLGEGAYGAIFIDGGGRIGLGSRRWNEHSVRAWNILGEDYVSIFANGNGVIDLNDDIMIIDKLPLVATENFGNGSNSLIMFYSSSEREIRIPAGGELDLSSFGQGDAYSQQIAFGGKVKLVLEPGAKIRFPDIPNEADRAKAPALYFDDESQLIILGNEDADELRWKDRTGETPPGKDTTAGSDKVRCKILGCGQIWGNKKAKIIIHDTALLGIEADKQTPHTDVVFSMRRNSQIHIGDVDFGGGGFQIGNMYDGGGDGTNVGDGAVATEVSCKLLIDGIGARMHLDREAFLGFAVGTVNKAEVPSYKMSSATADPDPDKVWRLMPLFNVKNITFEVAQGCFEHNMIVNGANKLASLMAIGELGIEHTDGTYKFELGKPDEAIILGGGNVLYMPSDGATLTSPYLVNLWDTASSRATDFTGTAADAGKYSILAPDIMMRTRTAVGDATITASSDAYEMSTDSTLNMYFTMVMPNYPDYPSKFIAAGPDQFNVIAGYVNGDKIIRKTISVAKDDEGNLVDARKALEKGYFIGGSTNSSGDPRSFITP